MTELSGELSLGEQSWFSLMPDKELALVAPDDWIEAGC